MQRKTERLPCGVTVAREFLALLVRVRVLPRQQSKAAAETDSAAAFVLERGVMWLM